MDSPLHRFAAGHDGVVTVRTAARLGYDWPTFRAIVTSEGWTRVLPAAYLAPRFPDTLRARVRAVQLRQPVLVASHRSAAALYGGDLLTTGLDVTVDGTGRHDVPGGRLFQWRLEADETTSLDGLRVTTPGRTAADLLRALPRNEAVIAVDGLLRTGATTVDAVAAALERATRRRGARRAWSAFRMLDPRSESVAETQARLVMRSAGLCPQSQRVVVDRHGRRIRVDFWFSRGVAVEIEGYAHHSSREQHAADIARFNELARLPDLAVLRFSWADVFHRPAAVVATTRAALGRTTVTTAGAVVAAKSDERYS